MTCRRPAVASQVAWLAASGLEEADFVALKFDVDEGNYGSTLEWGFLADLVRTEAVDTCRDAAPERGRVPCVQVHSDQLALVDEIFIELHFTADRRIGAVNFWHHGDHSQLQAFDLLRQLRRCGIAVHAWP